MTVDCLSSSTSFDDLTDRDEVHYGASFTLYDHETLIKVIKKWYDDGGYKITKNNIFNTSIGKGYYYGIMISLAYINFYGEYRETKQLVKMQKFIRDLEKYLGNNFDGKDLYKYYLKSIGL